MPVFEVSGSMAAGFSRKAHPSAQAPYFDFELLFLVASATQVEIKSQKLFCTAYYGDNVVNGFVPLCAVSSILPS